MTQTGRQIPRTRPISVQAGLGDAIRDLFDFEKWAPRSSQAWRLGQEPVSRNSRPTDATPTKMTESDVEVLNQRLSSSRSSMGSMDVFSKEETEELAALSNSSSGDEGASFLRSTDEEFADALNSRITQMATASTSDVGNDSRDALSGAILAELIYSKYGKKHDVSFVRRDIPGKTIVSLLIYHAFLGQRSFPMTEEEYVDKLDGVALYLEAWGQAETVIAFLKSPVAPRRGLPSRPIVGNAVAITLDLTNEQISEWFGR